VELKKSLNKKAEIKLNELIKQAEEDRRQNLRVKLGIKKGVKFNIVISEDLGYYTNVVGTIYDEYSDGIRFIYELTENSDYPLIDRIPWSRITMDFPIIRPKKKKIG